MKLRTLFFLVPALAALKLTACSDGGGSVDDPGATDGGKEGGGPGDDAAADAGPQGKGECTVTKKGTAGIVLQGKVLLPESAIDGEVFIDAKGNIACADKACGSAPAYVTDGAAYTAAYGDATVVKCTDAVISPGLVNTHDHISFANTPPRPHGTERYEYRNQWRKGLDGHTPIKTLGTGGANAIRVAELRFVMSGATATAGAGGADGLLRNVDNNAGQLEGARMKIADSDTFPLRDSNVPPGYPPVACVGWPANRRTASSIANLDGYLPHISEGIAPVSHLEFTCQSDTVGDPTHDLMAKQTAVVHGIGLTATDIAKYRPKMSALVWSPRSNIDLYGNTASVVTYDNLGVQIALGTDWLPSGSMNMSRELRCADELNTKYFNAHFTDKALWKMVTTNAAFAIGASSTLGMLKPGYAGDVAVFSAKGIGEYRAVVQAGVEDVLLVLRGGEVLYGDASLLSQDVLGSAACEDIDVCGVAKKACVKKDLGSISLADLQAEADKVYPLFYCKGQAPKDEPSCVPYRGPTASSPSSSVYTSAPGASDKDGDGVENQFDNCPDVFNPVRPQDDGKQADVDGDGIGDACDKCPTESGEACTPPSADDVDGDGVPNGTDNCPELANPNQEDGDKDGKGDACDVCPAEANPGQTICAQVYTVEQLRNPAAAGHPTSGAARAKVKDLYVTAVKSAASPRGFFAQVGTAAFSGLFVETTAAPTVQVGNKVDVEGDYEEVFGITTLRNTAVTVTDSGTTLPFGPSVFTTVQLQNNGASAEPYEGMLCELVTVTVATVNPDGAQDFDEFEVTDASAGKLRVDDYLYAALDNTYALSAPFSKITGICGFSFSNRKLWPRSAADVVP